MMRQTPFEMTAKTFYGLEPILVQELEALGAQQVKALNRAVSFVGDQEMMYRANLWCRTALRILKPIAKFRAVNEIQLYRSVQRIDWTRLMGLDDTFAIDATVRSDIFTHSQYVGLKVKDAIADQFRQRTGARPSVDVENPTLLVNVHLMGEDCIISLDSSGESLSRRGYRKQQEAAPLNEVLAAGLIALSGWKGDKPFMDGMCGSGTLLIEAGMMATDRAPGLKRRFGFMGWADFDERLWMRLVGEAAMRVRPAAHPIVGSDISESAVEVAIANATRAGLEEELRISRMDFFERQPPKGPGVAILNPPYGERIGENVDELYAQMGDQFKKAYKGYQVWMISSNREALKKVGLRASRRLTVFNGALECRFMCFDIFAD